MKKTMRNWLTALIVIMMAALLCPVSASAAKISLKKVTLYTGETKKVTLSGAKGKVTWKSSKTAVAAVNKNGTITAKKVGKCTVSARNAGKTYKCVVTVKKLPKTYAILNGKRVKVGKTVTYTYSVQSTKKIAEMRLWYLYDRKALKVNVEDWNRFRYWGCDMSWPELIINGKNYESYQLWGLKTNGDTYSPVPIDCRKAKVFDTVKIKVLKSGVYQFKKRFEFWGAGSSRPEIKGAKVSVKIK